MKCEAFTKRGQDCRQNALTGSKFCENHKDSNTCTTKPSRKERNLAMKTTNEDD